MRVPPQSGDSEKALLGSILLRPSGMYDIVDIISADSFYVARHATIFRAMLALFQEQQPIDVVSVSEKLQTKKELDVVGGNAYLIEITKEVPSSTNVEYYAKLVSEKQARRGLIDAGDVITELGFRESEPIEEVLDKAEKQVFAITQRTTSQRFVGIKELIPGRMEEYERIQSSEGVLRGVPTGFKSLDSMLSGFQKSDLIILAARPSMGKTSLALDFARKSAIHHGTKVGFFSLEMSKEQLVDRMISSESQIDSWRIRTGRVHEHELSDIRTAMDSLSKASIFIEDTPGNSVLSMRSTARRLKREHGLDLIVVDYLQLMTTSQRYESLVHQVTEISRSLKSLARELEVPVIALSQLSRAVESRGGKPRLSDLRDSGSIEQDADLVMFIHREDRYREDAEQTGIAEILIEKHRNGATGRLEMFFDKAKTTFVDIEKREGYEQQFETSFTGQAGGDDDLFETF